MKKRKLILIGSSTGGPGHLEKILASLDTDYCSTIIIAQHIDSIFLPSMVSRFNKICAIDVMQAKENIKITNPCVVFLHDQLTNLVYNSKNELCLLSCKKSSNYEPSIDFLFSSASKLHDKFDILACLLTGIGDDGAKGMLSLKKNGAHCISEDEKSCIVYGMPKAAYELNAHCEVLTLDKIVDSIKNFK